MGKKLSYVIVLAIAIVIVLIARAVRFSGDDVKPTSDTVVTSSEYDGSCC